MTVLFRLIARFFPPELRGEMAQVFEHCLSVERAKRGSIGRLFAGWRGIVDATTFAVSPRHSPRATRHAQHATRNARRNPLMLRDDLRGAFRLLLKNPMFTMAVVATLALGIGAATAMWTVTNAVLLRPLPLPQSEQLYAVGIESDRNKDSFPLSDADVLAWQAMNQTFSALAVYSTPGLTITGFGEPESARAVIVAGKFFETAGVQPQRGRVFADKEPTPAIILSDAFWARKFGRDESAVGRTLTINSHANIIVGIMPAGFTYPRKDTDLWRSFPLDVPTRRGPFYWTGVARLRDGVDSGAAKADLDRTTAALKAQYGGPPDWHLTMESVKDQVVKPVRPALIMLLAAVGCLLLIAIANAANLLLVRGVSRAREIAVRAALGAGRARVMRQLGIESLVLAAVAGMIGAGLAYGLIEILKIIAADQLPRLAEVRLDGPALAAAAVVSIAAGVLFGLVPALVTSRSEIGEVLKQAGRTGNVARRSWTQRLVVSTAVALAIVLASGAGLLVRSFNQLRKSELGIRTDHLLTFYIDFPPSRHARESRQALYDEMFARIQAIPGVESAAYGVALPPDQLDVTDNYTVEGFEAPPGQSAPVGPLVVASHKYFETLGIPLRSGRTFDATDTFTSPKVVVISETIAKRYFPNGDAVGHRLKTGGSERPKNPWMTIIGVVGDVRFDGLASPPSAAYYMPLTQELWTGGYIAVRTRVEPAAVLPAARAAVWALDKDVPIRRVYTMEELLARASAQPRFHTIIASGFGVFGVLLAAFGIYSVVSYSTSQRTKEFGLRIALGATPAGMRSLVVREGLLLAAIGTIAGVGIALASTRWLSDLLYGVTPRDPWTFAALVLLFVLVALGACLGPARRASRVDPVIALRND